MAQQTINVGAAPNDGTGTPLRTAFQYTNSNFSELYTAVGPSGNNIVVPGSATITGDLTVDTSTLKVDATNNRVGIGTASPTVPLEIRASDNSVLTTGGSANFTQFKAQVDSGAGCAIGSYQNVFGYVGTSTNHYLEIRANNISQHRIDPLGVFAWYDGAGGTRMTLNSTGLGVGGSPVNFPNYTTIHAIGKTTTAGGVFQTSTSNNSTAARFACSSTGVDLFVETNHPLAFYTNATEKMRIDTSGNVGIGVTPSAWYTTGGYRALQIGNASLYGRNSTNSEAYLSANAFENASASPTYITSSFASRYTQDNGVHKWLTAPSGTAGNTITFTQAMTLDVSGNLLVGVTSALFNSRLRVKTSSTSASDYGVYFADSADALIFALRNDGLIYTGTKTASPYNNTTGSAANAFIAADGTLGRSTSSLKYKTDITDSTRGLADVLKLRPVTYKSKNGDDTIFGGLIAEEVHAAGLTEFVAYAPDNAPDAIHYSNMVSLLVAAIKELTARVQTLETR
jgi:hypothetical protein